MVNDDLYAFFSIVWSSLFVGILVISIIGFIIYVISKIAYWKIFSKAGKEGWRALIPIYNQYVLCQIVGVSPWWMLICASAAILSSVSEIFATLFAASSIYFSALLAISLAKSFGKSEGFGIVTFFFNFVGACILGFDKSEYLGPKPLNDIILNAFTNKDSSNNESNTTQDADNFKFCSYCGTKINKDSSFCTSCGKKVD